MYMLLFNFISVYIFTAYGRVLVLAYPIYTVEELWWFLCWISSNYKEFPAYRSKTDQCNHSNKTVSLQWFILIEHSSISNTGKLQLSSYNLNIVYVKVLCIIISIYFLSLVLCCYYIQCHRHRNWLWRPL